MGGKWGNGMECRRCKYWSQPYGFCRLDTTNDPRPTGEPATCAYYKHK